MIDVFIIWIMVSFGFICISMAYAMAYIPSDKLSKLEIVAFVTSPGMPIFILVVILLQDRKMRILRETIEHMRKEERENNE